MQIPEHQGSWSTHVNSWLNSRLEHLVIRYEDMLNSPYITFHKACQFLKLNHNEEQIKKALKFSQFNRLQKIEQKTSFEETAYQSNHFFRKGIAGDWLNTLSAEQITRIIDYHGETMKKLNYLDSNGNPTVA